MPVGRQAKHAEEVRKVRKGDFKQAKAAKLPSRLSVYVKRWIPAYCNRILSISLISPILAAMRATIGRVGS